MRGLRRRAGGRTSVALLLPVLVAAIVLMSGGVALADQWTDISDSTWVNTYGVTPAQAAVVSDGYTDGTFRPMQAVTRGQFAKFTVDGFGIAKANPAAPSFRDVGRSNTFYVWIEGGVAAGVISGYTDGTFKPTNTISRQQSNNILGSYLSKKELTQEGEITGSKGTYSSLTAWYAAEGPAILAAFKDATSVASVHAPGTAYLVYHQVVKGSNGNLTPNSSLTRAQAVALIVRVKGVTFGGGQPGAPLVSLVNPAAGPAQGGNNVAITGANFTGATAVKFGNVSAASFTVNSATSITAIAPAGAMGSTVDVTVTTAAGTSALGNNTKYSYGLPTVTLLEPNGGSGAGGTAVTITGTGFTGVTYVRFGTTVAKSFVVLNPTTITAVSPAGTTGTTVDVVVTTAAGSSIPSDASKFTYGVPVVNKIQPGAGPAAGGNTITITGSGFTEIEGPAGVKFVSGTTTVNAPSYTVNSSSQITATVPPGTEGTSVDVVVTNTVGSSGMSYDSKYSYGAPTITKLDPAGGKETGGDKVFIVGTGFTGVTSVKFGATTLNTSSYTMNSPTQITVTATPPGTAGSTVEVVVTTAAGSNPTASSLNDYTYGLPTVTKVEPAAGPVTSGQTVVITGANLTGASAVKFGAYAATFVVNSASQITATSPGGQAGTVDVLVTTPAGTSAPSANSKYSFGTPTVSKLEPASGPTAGGNSVKITGERFTGVTAVKFGGNSAGFVVDSPTQITATAPPGTLGSTVDVIVTTPAGSSLASSTSKYEYVGLPTVTAINPATGPTSGGNTVTITGSYFVTGTTVKFGGNSATNVTVVSDTEMTVTAPAGTSGSTVNVIVTNPAGSSLNTAADDYTYGMPRITSLNPAAGSNAGGNTVIISGSGFVSVDEVKFGDRTATIVGSYTQTQITVTAPVPAATNTTVDVTVKNSVGTSEVTASTKYSYGIPRITKLEPNGGPSSGGNSVVITGTGFTGLSGSVAVKFGDNPATSYVVDSPTQITAVAPSGSGTVRVSVTNPEGPSVNNGSLDDYSYGIAKVTGLNPAAGPDTGGNSVVITGSGFLSIEPTHPADAVKFGLTQASSYVVDSDSQITAVVPAGTLDTTVDVTVNNGAGWSATSAAAKYSYGKPRITRLEPNGGPTAGGNTVVIYGYGFTGLPATGAVVFGSLAVSASNIDVDEDTLGAGEQKMTVKAREGDDWVYVRVTNTAGVSDTGLECKYSYGVPTITSIDPAAGSVAGGDNVVIIGTNFGSVSGAAGVMFGTTNATSYTVNSSTRITAKAPAQGTMDKTVDVKVTNTNGPSSASLATKYSYGKPTIISLTPSGGAAGTKVTIQGTGFTGVTGASAVVFGGSNATSYEVKSDTEIEAYAPSGTGTVQVRVTNPEGASDPGPSSEYSYGAPTVTNLNPASGSAGSMVIITGTNFTGVTAVKFGNRDATSFVVNDYDMITATAPPEAGTGSIAGTVYVRVTNGAGDSPATGSSQFSYGLPTVESIQPNSGVAGGGNYVTINGTRFTGSTSGVLSIKFGGVNATTYTVNSPTQITVRVPAGTNGTTVEVAVTTDAGTNILPGGTGNDYHYGVPTVTKLEQASGPIGGGNQVIIKGTNFTNVNEVYFGGAAHPVGVANFTVNSSTQITVTSVPDYGAAGTVDVTVKTDAGESEATLASKYTYGPPNVNVLNPATGPETGNNTVVITGTGFTGVRWVYFGGEQVSAANVTVNSPTQITVKAPPGSGTVDVQVTTYGGVDPETDNDYVYY